METVRSEKKYLIVLVLIVAVVGCAYLLWDRFSETGKTRRWAREAAEAVEKGEKAYVDAMTADTYGGKTPQETLDLFVAALRAGDVDLASKYFLLDEGLSQKSHLELLKEIENDGLLSAMIKDIELRAKPDTINIINDNDFKFVLYDDFGKVGARINMQFNRYSKIWKIESL